MRTRTTFAAVVVTAALLVACGDDDSSGDDTTTTGAAATTTSEAATTTSTEAAATTSTEAEETSTTEIASLEQPAIWPAADVIFTTPEEAAVDFVEKVLGVPAVLSEYMAGDSRSGEMIVYSPGEGDAATPVARGLLALRQLGPADGWFVIAAINEFAAISTPESMAEVPAGSLTVEGVGRGFEANIVVTAFIAGDYGTILDQQITMGGAMETAEPFSVTLDLSAAAPGDVVVLLVRGGVGLETDPGEFGAIPVVIAA